MEEMWNLRACLNRSTGQPSPGSSTLNQFDMNPGQLSQPYVAQEVCVIERTIRQEPVGPSMMNFGPHGLSANKLRSELLASVSGLQQQQHRPSYPPSISARSTYIASHPQFSHMNSTDSTGLGGWPTISPPNLLHTYRMNGNGSSNSGPEAPQSGQGRDLSVMTGGRIQENDSSNGLRTPGSELLKQSVSFSRGTQEQGVDVSRQSPSPQWLTEIVSRRQRFQSVQASTLFSANSDLHRTESSMLDMGSGLANQSQSVPGPAPSGRLRVFCSTYAGPHLGGELCLTDTGRLGVICTCHSMHMSVAKFTQHAGIFTLNPGESVFLEGGETLVQWRRTFFTQYGVKVPEDNVGWEWLDVDSVEAGQGKYKAVMTQSWQKEVGVSYGGNTPMVKSRTTQVWDASLANGSNSTLHATQSISNMKFAPLNTGQGGMQDSRDPFLKSFGRAQRGGTMPLDFGSNQFYSDIAVARSQGSTGSSTSFHSTSHIGDMPLSNEYKFINDGGHRSLSHGQQVTAALRNVKGLNYPSTRWGDGQEPCMKENDSFSSSFELRLGQPSQQTQPSGASFSSMAAPTVEHPTRLFDQIMSKVWDGRLQPDLQQFNPAGLPIFSGNPGQARERPTSTSSRQPVHERTSYMDSSHMDGQSAEDRSSLNSASIQSARHMVNPLQSAFNSDAMAEHLQAKFSTHDSGPQSNKLSRSGDCRPQTDQSGLDKPVLKFVPHTDQLRSVTLENGTTLDSLSSGALVHLSNKTGQRLLETAIQSSFGYRAMGQEGLHANSNDGLNRRAVGESLPGDLGVHARPPFPPRASLPNFAMRHDLQNDFMVGPHGALDSTNAAQLQQVSNGAVHIRVQGAPSIIDLSMHKSPLEESSIMHDDLRGRKGGQPSSEECQDWSGKMNGKHVELQEQQPGFNAKRTWSLSAPESDSIIDAGLGSKVKTFRVQRSGLSEDQGGSKASGAEHHDSYSQPPPDLAAKGAEIGEEQDIRAQGDPDIPTDNREDRDCTCLKCRKASPSTRGRAVPRLAGQVCLKEKGGNGTKMDPAKKTQADNAQRPSIKCPSSQNQQKSSEPQSDMVSAKTVKIGKCTRDPSSQPLPWENVRGMSEERSEQHETDARSEPSSHTAMKGAPAVAGSSHTPKALSDVCSKSSENVLSGLSDEGCGNDRERGTLLAQSNGKVPAVGVLDECSGIGKCSSSDGVDMGVATNPNPVSTSEDPSKRESPSSLGCPSSNNVAKRLIVKRSGPRATGGWHVSKEPEQDDPEPEPVLSGGTLEKKRRRTMKWKRLDSDVGAGEAKKGKSVLLAEQITGPKVPVEKPDVGIKLQKAEDRPDQGAKDRGLLPKASAEKEPLLKRRRVAVTIDIPPSVSEEKETEANEEKFGMREGDGAERKVGTLVIRVPQGVNRQKAKRIIRTNLNPMPAKGSRPDVCEEACHLSGKITEGSVVGNSATTKGTHVIKSPRSIAAGSTVPGPSTAAPSLLTKNLRSVRTPLGGPSPQSGRMVSLSVIMKQPAEPQTHFKVREGPKEAQTIKADMAKSKSDVPKPEGVSHKKLDASVAFVAITPRHHNEKDFALPEMEPWKEERSMRDRWNHQKEEAQKVRSLWELTGKDKMPGSGAEVFDFAEEDPDLLRPGKLGTTTVQAGPTLKAASLSERSFPFPRSGRSVRSTFPNKRNVEWHRSKDAQEDPGKSDSEAVEEETIIPRMNRTVPCASLQPSAARNCIPRLGWDLDPPYEVSPVRKQVRSSKLKKRKVVLKHPQAKDRTDTSADTKLAREVEVKVTFAESGIPKRVSDHVDVIDSSAKRLKFIGGFNKLKEKAEGPTDKAPESCKDQFLPDKEIPFKRLVHDPPGGKIKLLRKGKFSEDGKLSSRRKIPPVGGSDCNQSCQPEKSKCDVCGTSASVSYNKLLCCRRCPVKVHQACYGVSKVPKGHWSCRTCKFSVPNPVCVLCGYGGGAMTRVQKCRAFCQAILQAWRDLDIEKEKVPSKSHSDDDEDETLLSATISIQSTKNNLLAGIFDKFSKKTVITGNSCELCSCGRSGKNGSFCKACMRENTKAGSTGGGDAERPSSTSKEKSLEGDWRSSNTITAVVKDVGAKQWAHMVCTLWMPGTRCLNMGTMGVFDVSGVAISRRKAICSICQRKGGACIQCRVPECSTPFHVWCAHEKGLLQSETVQDGTNQVGFFGKCQRHGNCVGSELDEDEGVSQAATTEEMPEAATSRETCARTEGYKGRQTLEERAKSRQQMTLEGSMSVTPEQIAAWLRINDRKSITRRFIKPANSVMKYDHREYLRFKQNRGWKRLAVYKSGIHALGLYTTDFIAEGEVVVEYKGEIVGLRVADKREAEYHSGKRMQYQSACYLFRIDTEQIIDATRKGGIARFVNHSCSPNCVAKVICVDNLKKVIFFAKRDIYALEEVTYDYKFNYDEVGDKIPCFCGSSDCRGTLN